MVVSFWQTAIVCIRIFIVFIDMANKHNTPPPSLSTLSAKVERYTR